MNAVDHNNVVIFDDRGIPSIMCRFVRPKDAGCVLFALHFRRIKTRIICNALTLSQR